MSQLQDRLKAQATSAQSPKTARSEAAPVEISAPETLPLDRWHRDAGARMVPFAGYDMPLQYEGVMAEHLWTRENAGLFDVSHMGQLLLTGDGVSAALECLVPGNITALKPGHIRYTLLLAKDGGILDDLMVTNISHDAVESLYLVVNGATKHDDIRYLRANLPGSVTIEHLDEQALLALQGPKAAAALERILPGVTDNLYFMQGSSRDWNGAAIGIGRSGYTGEDGFELSLPAGQVAALANALIEMEEVKPVGLGARDSLRLEAGLPLYGHDMDADILPVEAGLNFALSKARREDRNFAGAERVLAQYPDKAKKKRVGLTIEGRQPVREGAVIIDDAGETIGAVTSGGFSPSLQRPIAMAYVPAALAQNGTGVTALQRGKRVMCTVTAMPFISHNYHRKPKI